MSRLVVASPILANVVLASQGRPQCIKNYLTGLSVANASASLQQRLLLKTARQSFHVYLVSTNAPIQGIVNFVTRYSQLQIQH